MYIEFIIAFISSSKAQIWLFQVGEKLGKFEVEKRQAVETEDYEKAKLKKAQMEEYRVQMYQQLDLEDLLEIAGVCIPIVDLPVAIDRDARKNNSAK